MIELQDDRIAQAAVGARRLLESLLNKPNVAQTPPTAVPADEANLVETLPTASSRGAPAMAVGADDLAPVDLPLDLGGRSLGDDERRDLGRLAGDVVELQDDRVVDPALDARVSFEPRQHVAVEALTSTAFGDDAQADVALCTCSLTMRLGARPAPVLPPAACAREGGDGQFLSTL